jgi:hypothetical protein
VFDLAIHCGETIRGKGAINAEPGALGIHVLKESRGTGLLYRYSMRLPRLFQLGEFL